MVLTTVISHYVSKQRVLSIPVSLLQNAFRKNTKFSNDDKLKIHKKIYQQ